MAIFTTSRFTNEALEKNLYDVWLSWYSMSDEELEKIIKQREKEYNEIIDCSNILHGVKEGMTSGVMKRRRRKHKNVKTIQDKVRKENT